MNKSSLHSFHIPVMGLGFSIDTPLKVARYGISSVISVMDDELIEQMRAYYCLKEGRSYVPIHQTEIDFRARRITAYLNLADALVTQQMEALIRLPFEGENELVKYFQLLPEHASLKIRYHEMTLLNEGAEKQILQQGLKNEMLVGALDVNIMAKVDKLNKDTNGKDLPAENSDALAAFRGFANSKLNSAVIFSAGYNPGLYNYVEQFPDFFPDENGRFKKKIILKVSDFRSALIQGKLFAKKGLWISEFRVESGLNCGGHAFPTEGMLLGPILDEFKNKREAFTQELFELFKVAIAAKKKVALPEAPPIRITVQGGIGTANEHDFLLQHYALDAAGWGSPFLLVPEATNVDEQTIGELATAKKEDYYISDASPLGIAFNNFRKSSAHKLRLERIAKGRPGSPCYKKFLVSDTEFTDTPICTASREYQHHKINQLKEKNLAPELFEQEFDAITGKDCLCEGLGSAVLLKDHINLSHNLSAVTICPGPNLAYFSGIFSLKEMVNHIYGRANILNQTYRPNMFINELHLYLDYFKNNCRNVLSLNPKQLKYLQTFKTNMLAGIAYYRQMIEGIKRESQQYKARMKQELDDAFTALSKVDIAI